MQRLSFYILISLVMLTGLGIAAYRHSTLGIPLTPDQEQHVWSIEAEIQFVALGDGTKVSLARPTPQAGYSIASENASSPGYGLNTVSENNERRIEWTNRTSRGAQRIYYRLVVVEQDPDSQRGHRGEERLSLEPPEPYEWEEPYRTAADSVVEWAWQRSTDAPSMARELLKMLNASDPVQVVTLLLGQVSPEVLLTRLLHQAGYPAHISYGLELEDGRRGRTLQPLIEVHDGKRWQQVLVGKKDPNLPPNFMLWHRGARSLLDVTGGSNTRVTFSTIREGRTLQQLLVEQFSETPLMNLTLYSLPIEEQTKFKALLLIPIGTLAVVFLRILVGLRTSGTFMPVLIALAFQQTTLLTGVIGLVLVVSAGLVVRQLLSHVNLLLVARIASGVIVVITIIAMFTLISYHMGLTAGLKITYFPLIILAWTIERMSVLWEEEGAHEVLVQGGGSLIVAILAYLTMELSWIRHLSFNFPELMLVTLGLIMLVGQYTGYRLLELKRFLPFTQLAKEHSAAPSDKGKHHAG